MNRVFVDTSAVIALLVATDEFHQAANSAFAGLVVREAPFLTTSKRKKELGLASCPFQTNRKMG